MTSASLLFIILMTIFAGFIMGVTPYISRKEIPFGVSMPLTEKTKPVINAKKKFYFVMIFGLSLIICVFLVLLGLFGHKSDETISYLSTIGLFLILVVSLVVYIRENISMKQYKKTLDLSESANQKVFVDLSFREKKLIFPTSYLIAINLVFILITLFVTMINYGDIPNNLVVHWNGNMQPDRIVNKSWWAVLTFPFFQIFIAILMAISNHAFLGAKQQISGNEPNIASNQDKKFRRGSSLFIYIISILMQSLIMLAQFFTIFPTQTSLKNLMIVSTFVFPIIIIIITCWYAFHYGQGGTRLKELGDDTKTRNQESGDDSHWIGGMIYFNRNDPSFWVEKRMGVGVTVNFAKWQAWLFIVLIILVPLALTLLLP